MNAVKAWFMNWFTSIAGGVAGLPQIIEGYTSVPKNWMLIISGIATLILGLCAKDADGTKPEDIVQQVKDAIVKAKK